jgi:hypothetical protein
MWSPVEWPTQAWAAPAFHFNSIQHELAVRRDLECEDILATRAASPSSIVLPTEDVIHGWQARHPAAA